MSGDQLELLGDKDDAPAPRKRWAWLLAHERFLPGTGWTPQTIDACVAAMDWSSCPPA